MTTVDRGTAARLGARDRDRGGTATFVPPAVDVAALVCRATPGRHYLFVSAPFGPFCRELAGAFEAAGAKSTRVILNGGDAFNWGGVRPRAVYAGLPEGWRSWLIALIARTGVTDVVTYGDTSFYAAAALDIARDLGLRTFVLEQGYFRPDWVTLERQGVNAHSDMPRHAGWYRERARQAETGARKVGRTTPAAILHISAYHVALYAASPIFRHFRSRYYKPAILQAAGHVWRLGHQRVTRARARRDYGAALDASGPKYLALLQRPGDSQLWRHSRFKTIRRYAEHVVESFAARAPLDARLMFRPHPLDPGLEPHGRHISEAAERAGIAGRVSYVDHGKLHEILPRMAGVICVNSTAGLAAVEFGRPTIALGAALYDMPGLTFQGGLDAFWQGAEAPDADLYLAFRDALMARTQINGAYATRAGRALAVPALAQRMLAGA